MHENRKEKVRQYAGRKTVGGIFMVKCTATNHHVLNVTVDIDQSRNRFDFSVKTHLCYDPRLADDWKVHGKDSFTFEVLETLEKGATQTESEFKADLDVLMQIWKERVSTPIC